MIVPAYTDAATRQEAIGKGVWQVLAKPVDVPKLLALVDEAVGQRLVLVVDVDPDLCASLWDVLRDRGYQVASRATRNQVQSRHDSSPALQAAHAEPPDVILVDGDSSGVDSCRFAQEVRQLPVFRRPLVVAVAGADQRSQRPRSLEAGIHLHLLKPVNKDFLCRVLRRFQSVIMPTEEQAHERDLACATT